MKEFLFLIALNLTIGSEVYSQTEDPVDSTKMVVYHIGNSLTRNIPLERLKKLFASEGVDYQYGMQLGGGHQLDQHLVKRNHHNRPGEGKYNTIPPYGEYDHAFLNYNFDAVVLQPYLSILDQEPVVTNEPPYFEAGSLQAAGKLIDYALGRIEPGSGTWYQEHPNSSHRATDRFYIYATWPKADQILNSPGHSTYADYYSQPFQSQAGHTRAYFQALVMKLNQRHPDLNTPVRLIPAGQVLAVLDQKIRDGELPGIVEFYQRNQQYFQKSRRNGNTPAPFDPEDFEPAAGVLNFYADNVHLNDQPHNGEDSGTIGSYCAALTVYSVLSGKNPVGLTVAPYEMFDQDLDAELIKALQETVWEVVLEEHLSGSRP